MSTPTKHIGETNIADNGMKMTIIAYRNSRDIDVKCEDGTTIYHKRYDSFKQGKIYPQYDKANVIAKRIGQKIKATNGMTMTCIAYHRSDNVDVQFEDGTIVYNRRWGRFKKGQIGHPNMTGREKRRKTNRIGETAISKNNNLKMTIIEYNGVSNIDVQFENKIIKRTSYEAFKRGTVPIPEIINNVKIKEFAYIFNNEWYYICSNPEWKEDKILSVTEIYQNKYPEIKKKKIMPKRFTKDELELITDISISNEQLAKQLNRSIDSIIGKRRRLKKTINKIRYSVKTNNEKKGR